jgi:hypothetical protein
MSTNIPRLDREALSQSFTAAMSGHLTDTEGALGIEPIARPTAVKTYAIEVHLDDEDESPMSRIRAFGERLGFELVETADPTVGVLRGPELTFFVDALDPRFWLVHTTSGAHRAQSILARAIWASRDLDWCWFTASLLNRLVDRRQVRWFKSDFRGDELLPSQGVGARRMRIQLEGDNASSLYQELANSPKWGSAAALTSVAFPLTDSYLGQTDEVANYRGRFVARGESFELHLGFVVRALNEYAKLISAIENRFRINWLAPDGGGFTFDGEILTIQFPRPIADMERFVSGLFSCREPFRLWAVPRSVTANSYDVEVVDLHIGSQLRMDITDTRLRVYLTQSVCGNSVARLLANLQHRYDASIDEMSTQLVDISRQSIDKSSSPMQEPRL